MNSEQSNSPSPKPEASEVDFKSASIPPPKPAAVSDKLLASLLTHYSRQFQEYLVYHENNQRNYGTDLSGQFKNEMARHDHTLSLLGYAVAEVRLLTGKVQLGLDGSLPPVGSIRSDGISALLQHYGKELGEFLERASDLRREYGGGVSGQFKSEMDKHSTSKRILEYVVAEIQLVKDIARG